MPCHVGVLAKISSLHMTPNWEDWSICAVIQGDLGRLEKRADRNLVKFNKEKSKVLHLWWNNLRHQYMLATAWLESSLAEKDLEVQVDTQHRSHDKIPKSCL